MHEGYQAGILLVWAYYDRFSQLVFSEGLKHFKAISWAVNFVQKKVGCINPSDTQVVPQGQQYMQPLWLSMTLYM